MRISRLLAVVILFCGLMLPLGCGGGGSTGEVEEMAPEDQAEIEAIRESYGASGRYGPGGQDTPPPAAEETDAGEGEGGSAPE